MLFNNNVSAVHNPRILPMPAVPFRITASTGSTCSIEPRNTWSSDSKRTESETLPVHSLAIRAISNNDPLCQYSQYEHYRTLKYFQSALAVSPVLPTENSSDAHLSIRHTRSTLRVMRVPGIYLNAASARCMSTNRVPSESIIRTYLVFTNALRGTFCCLHVYLVWTFWLTFVFLSGLC